MSAGDKHYLAEDKYSTMKRGYLYGKKGEPVTEISRSDKVLVVQGKKERFSVTTDQLILKTN